MITVISPAKSLDFCNQSLTKQSTIPDFLNDSEQLIGTLRKVSRARLGDLMGISPKLAELNYHDVTVRTK